MIAQPETSLNPFPSPTPSVSLGLFLQAGIELPGQCSVASQSFLGTGQASLTLSIRDCSKATPGGAVVAMAIVHPDQHTWVPWLSWVRTFNPLPIGYADEETEGGGFNDTHWGKYLECSR